MPKVTKKHALFPIAYDEISLVDEGAAGSAHVLIAKRGTRRVTKMYPSGEGGSSAAPKNKIKPLKVKGDFLEGSRKREKELKRKAKKSEGRGSESWEKRIKRAPAGSPAGGEFSETSAENKRKYGKNGTTKAKQTAGSRADSAKKGDGNGYGRTMRDTDGDGDHDPRTRKNGLNKVGSIGDVKQQISDWGDIPKKDRARQKAHLLRRAKSLGAGKDLLAKIEALSENARSVDEITSDPEQQAAIRRRRKKRQQERKSKSKNAVPYNNEGRTDAPVKKSALGSWDQEARNARVRSILERN